MVCSCSAYGCTEQKKSKGGISFHSFPKDIDLRKRWVIASKRKNFTPTTFSKLCGRHFRPEDFIRHFGQLRLVKNAVPSIFNFPDHLRSENPNRRRPPKRRLESEPSIDLSGDQRSELVTPIKNPRIDFESESLRSTSPLRVILPTTPKRASRKRQRRLKYEESGSRDLSLSPKRFGQRTQPAYFGDCREEQFNSPRKAKQMWDLARTTINRQRKTIKYLRNKTYRLQRQITTLRDLVEHLRTTDKISENCYSVLQECLPPNQQQLLLKQIKLSTERKYPEELRIFALTLHFYSGAAYNYVRKTFSNCLPHPKTLQKWYSAVDGSPGYTQESLRAIEIKVKEMQGKGKSLVCGLMMDEMSLRKHVQWNGKRQVGYINYGLPMDNDSLPVAKEAIVFMLVALNCRWKVPIGYFLINGLNTLEKSNLVKGCLTMLQKTQVIITSLTFDGTATNLSMARALGANLSVDHLKTDFRHPVTQEPIHIILDACHMIKLIRNALGDLGIIYDGNGNAINWKYFKFLVELQETEGLHAATKLRRRHINYYKEKMKVKLASQTFSDSVADAFDYCEFDLNLNNFQGANPTAKFCRYFNNIFDIMNTRNCLSKSKYKRALSSDENLDFVKNFFSEAKNYILGLKNETRIKIVEGNRKTGFLGLLVNMQSIQEIIKYHIKEHKNLDYLLTYKLSQDHLEMFFSNIRSRGGFNNNPTAVQFESAYKKILVHTELSSSEAANCLAQDETSILKITASSKRINRFEIDLIISDDNNDEFSEEMMPVEHLSQYVDDVVTYIAGFVVRKLTKSINCNVCASELTQNSSLSSLITRKNRGGLIMPSPDVIYICRVAEKIMRSPPNLSKNNINVIQKLILKGSRLVNFDRVFKNLNNHIMEQDAMNNHLIQIVYLIFEFYFTLRLKHVNNSLDSAKVRIRHFYTKLVIFNNQ